MNFKLPFTISERAAKILKVVGYVAFGIVMFAVFLYATLPVARFKEMAVTAAARAGWDLEVDEMSLGVVPGKVTLTDVVLTSRPKLPGEKIVRLPINEIGLDVELMKLMSKRLDVGFYAKVDDGKISGRFRSSKTEDRVQASGTVPMEFLPWLSQNVQGLPLAGGLALKLDLTLPAHKWAKASGSISLKCQSKDCTIGSEKSLTGTTIRMGDMAATLPISKGVATFKNFKATSPDGELEIVGRIEFADPVGNSEVKLCVRFKLDEELMQRADRMRSFLGFAYAGKLADGRYQNRLEGRFGRIRGIWTQSCPFDPNPTPIANNMQGVGGTGAAPAAAALPPPLEPPPTAAPPPPPSFNDVPRPPLPTVADLPSGSQPTALEVSVPPSPTPVDTATIVNENPPPYPVAKRAFKPFPVDDQPGQENFRKGKPDDDEKEREKEKEKEKEGDGKDKPAADLTDDKVAEPPADTSGGEH